jgi:hypothetical protein
MQWIGNRAEGISVSERVSLALAEKLSVLYAECYLTESAERGREVGANAGLFKVPNTVPETEDRIRGADEVRSAELM